MNKKINKHMKKIIFIHPGYPKSGTTFLQKNFFSKNKEINNLGKANSREDVDKRLLEIFDNILGKKEINVDDLKKFKILINSINIDFNKINLISFEAFTQINISFDLKEIFLRLKKIFDYADIKIKILITIRNQSEIILSHFANNYELYELISPKWKKFRNFLYDFENLEKKNNKNLFKILEQFKYFSLIQLLIEIFGKENIKVFINEELKNNPRQFCLGLSNYLGLKNFVMDVNVQYENETRRVGTELKRINKRILRNKNPFPIILKFFLNEKHKKIIKKFLSNLILDIKYLNDPIKLTSLQKKLIKEFYYNDNLLLQKYLNKELSIYGY